MALDASSWVAHVPDWVPDEAALMERLLNELPLKQETLKILGKDVLTPRLTGWFGDADARYVYSKTLFVPEPWTPGLSALRGRLFDALGVYFNGVLANHYRGGDDAMGWHSDDEKELGPRAPDDVLIASVSLGAKRRFLLKPRRGGTSLGWDLGGGDLFLMGGTTQRHYVHRLARTAKAVGPRLNLTFRIVCGDR
ncbi:MAG TPA: alpha-ketoglutarate-dependent dioxygenase AlkB [Myxococcota bacterium]|nr:alpha-ketoglutarate-dependent dioxygenase AlkB [Myxococcota bacterium]